MKKIPVFLSPRYHRQLAGCRVCRLVAATVFLAIVAIEVLILLPSYQNERTRTIAELTGQARAFAEGAVAASAAPAAAALPPGVLGLQVGRGDGTTGATFGQAAAAGTVLTGTALAVAPGPLSDGSTFAAWLDGEMVSARLTAFALRIAGLVLLIALVVTVAAMLVMGHTVLAPVLLIEQALNAAARSPDRAEFEPVVPPRYGEMRSVAEALNLLFAELTHFNRSEKLRNSLTDPLTGLANRPGLLAALAEGESGGGSGRANLWSLFLLDVDGFARINARQGHDGGDRVLKALAERLAAAAGEGDVVARTVGDEFVLASRVTSPEAASALGARLVGELSAPLESDGQAVTPLVSCAICLGGRARADEARLQALRMVLRGAKGAGGGRVRFLDAEFDAFAKRRRRLERALRGAAERGEFRVVYQPKISLRSGALTGAEALARWRLRDGEEVSPAEFVPICEDIGLVEELTRHVLRQVLADIAAWREAGLTPPRMAVNVSARQFRGPGLVDFIAESLVAAQAPEGALEIEITEGAFIGDMDHAVALLRQLKEIGVTAAIDDFGTGYSSLSYLRHLPVATLKIDRAFVQEIEADESARRIADTIVALGARLGMETVAEGVETEGQARMLRAAGCDTAQGWLFSRPVPAEAFAERLAADARGARASSTAA